MVSDKSQVWCLAGDCWIVSSNPRICEGAKQIFKSGFWGCETWYGQEGKSRGKPSMPLLCVCIEVGKLATSFHLYGSYFFVTKIYNYYFI